MRQSWRWAADFDSVDSGRISGMQRGVTTFARAMILAAMVPLVGACSSDGGIGNVNVVPKPSDLVRPDWMSFSGHREEFSLRPPGPEDLVGPEGQCAGLAQSQVEDQSGETAQMPAVQGGVALQMTECDVVRRAGAPERVELGANERGERAVVLTYARGPRPGVYRFAAGRLYSIERGPEPPAPARQQKAAAKKRS
jgi:hypothetical protein